MNYMYSNYKSINSLNDTTLTLVSCSKRENAGIEIWNDVFLHDVSSTGEKIAIILFHIQRVSNNKRLPEDNPKIFVLGSLISSIQAMNINGIMYDENLQYFNMINQFANLSSTKSFQKLTILINDLINNDNEFPSSHERYLEDVFKITGNQNEELKLLAKDAFEVTNIRRLSNTISANEEEKLIENLLSPNELVIKKVNGKTLTSIELFRYIEKYFPLFKTDKFPEIQKVYDVTVEIQNQHKQQESSSRLLNSANFEETYCLINRFFDEYLYADANPYNFDDKRRNIFTFKTHKRPHSKIWELIQVEPYERFYYIKNKERGEFLYAESEDYALDNDRRRVFTWIPKDDHNKVKFQWKVDFNAPLGEFFTILNREYQEYLYAFNGSGLDEYRRRIFTWRRKNKFDIQMLWKLVPC